MYELSRVRLHTVGPKGARYAAINLDLRDVGPLGGSRRRPSPATVLFLENGGGKSVLVKLIFSVMLPGRRQVVGTTSTRVLEKFVLGGDVAHIALEWQDPRTGQLLVTGKALEWRGHVVSSDPSRLIERWYSFRPTNHLSLDALPFTEDGRLVTLAGFHDRLEERQRPDPSARLVWEKNHGDWTTHLQDLRLDPELFVYQRKMNAGEGEAADAFTFKSDDAFVDWLLTAITPDEEPESVGELVTGYADKLGVREELMAERDFVAGALERLEPLVRAAAEHAAATEIDREARADAERLVGALMSRVAQESERERLLAEQLIEVDKRERLADQEVRRLNSIVLELNRLVAKLRWDEAIWDRKRLESERDAARDDLTAWAATETLVRYDVAHGEAEEIRRVVRLQESEAEPVLRARDDAAKRLARGLLAVASAADDEAATSDGQADGLDEDIGQAEDDERKYIGEVEAARARITQVEGNISAVRAAVTESVDAGLLGADENVAQSAITAGQDASLAEKALENALTGAEDLAASREQVAGELEDLRAETRRISSIEQSLASELERARRTGDELGATERLAELLGSEDVLLDTDAETLTGLLNGAINTAEREQSLLRLQDGADSRVLKALGEGGLLPPSDEIAAALAVLAENTITAWSGWQYLAMVSADERDQVIARYPHLVDGIVLNNGDDLEVAREELAAARLLPRTVIAVGTTAAIADLEVSVPVGADFIVPPNPAMYDAEQAELERQAIQSRQEARAERLTALGTAITEDRELSARLGAWRREYPPGRLTGLTAQHAGVATELKQLGEREKEKREAHLALVNTEKQLRAQLPGMNKAAGITKDRARSLTTLAERYAQIPGWQEVIRASREVITSTESEATRAHERAEALRHQQAEARRKADDNRRVATGCRDQLRGIPGGGSVDEAMPVPDESTESLRSTYWALELAYAKVEVGADLRSELSGRDHTEAEALAAVKRIDQSVLDRAAALLRTPDGGDAAARAAATERTRRLAADLESQVTRSAGEEGKRKETYERIQPQERSLEPYGPPRDIPHGKELIAAATQDRETAGDALEEVQHRKSALTDELAGAKQAISGFSAIRESLAGIVPILDPESAEPFSGVVEAARARRDRVRETSNEAARLLTGATDQVRRAADQLANHTSDERYEKVTSPVRRQMMATSRERLPEFAEEWETNLKPRLRVLSDELEQIERHRAAIITRLGGMVAYALGRLRAAQKASRLPDGLGDWSGLEFLRIAFTQPDEAVLTERIGQVVDDASGADGGKRDGLSLLLAGIHAAVRPKGVRVDMLKPDAVLRDERVRVSEIGDVFSGGQLLTAAIILYCTMASLRAAERGQARRQHAGVLFLDNPIGRASAGYLLELQLAVADKLHVQLVYTTGLFDTSALSVFPLILRLRNDADLRAGMKYLSVDSSIRAGLPADPPDGTGTLTASRVYSRPTA